MPLDDLKTQHTPLLPPHTDDEALSTQERILSAAEALYIHQGFDATPLRAITRLAGVNLAAVNYHFKNKEGLIRQLLTRRLDPLHHMRLTRLALYLKSPHKPKVEKLLEIMFLPALELARDDKRGGPNFLKLIGRAYSDPAPYTQALLSDHYKETIAEFKNAFVSAVPHVPLPELRLRLHFTMSALSSTLASQDLGRLLQSLRNKSAKSNDDAIVLIHLIPFLAAGLTAPATV